LKLTQTVIPYVIDPLFTPFDALVTEIRVKRGYSPGTPEGISPRSGRNRFQIPLVRPGCPPGISPGPRTRNGWRLHFHINIS
jgi:hypothetical protein